MQPVIGTMTNSTNMDALRWLDTTYSAGRRNEIQRAVAGAIDLESDAAVNGVAKDVREPEVDAKAEAGCDDEHEYDLRDIENLGGHSREVCRL